MNTSEGILIEDGELTIHVRKASKVRRQRERERERQCVMTGVHRVVSTIFKSYSQKPKPETKTPESQAAHSSEISKMLGSNYERLQDELIKIELLKKFGGRKGNSSVAL